MPSARELIVGIADDPIFGPGIVFGRAVYPLGKVKLPDMIRRMAVTMGARSPIPQ